MADDYKDKIKREALDEAVFVRLTAQGVLGGQEVPWRRVIVRPVLIKGERYLQFSYFDQKKDITKNYRGEELEQKLDEVLALPFASIRLETTGENLLVQVMKDGKAIYHRSKPAADAGPSAPKSKIQNPKSADLSHDRTKDLPLPPGKPDAFLQALGIMDAKGKVYPSMQGKLSQINEFLKLLEHTGELRGFDHSPVQILDCGSGSAYLSFAAYHYLNDVLGVPARLVGIDVNGQLVDKSNANVSQLGLTDEEICFRRSAIADYAPDVPPDIVLALHACNTATDDAIALGVKASARIIMCAPCCHQELNAQLHTVDPFEPVMRHGILKERLADILTDSFRAQVLRIMGYAADVVEFVASEHTYRNLMIRAVKRTTPGNPRFLAEYEALKAYWGVTPHIEQLLPLPQGPGDGGRPGE